MRVSQRPWAAAGGEPAASGRGAQDLGGPATSRRSWPCPTSAPWSSTCRLACRWDWGPPPSTRSSSPCRPAPRSPCTPTVSWRAAAVRSTKHPGPARRAGHIARTAASHLRRHHAVAAAARRIRHHPDPRPHPGHSRPRTYALKNRSADITIFSQLSHNWPSCCAAPAFHWRLSATPSPV